MSERVIATERSQDLISLAILIDGNEIPQHIQINQIEIYKEVNRISYAKIVILDGDVASGNFEVSSSDLFVPGNVIEIQVGYHHVLKSVFKGVLIRQSIKIRTNGQSVLVVDCQDKTVSMTIGRNSKFFYNSKDSEIIEELIDGHGIDKFVASTQIQHVQMVQYDASDWDFMLSRVESNGLLCFINDGKIEIKKPDFSTQPVVSLTFGANILEYDGELDSRSQVEEIKAFSWDQSASEIIELEPENGDMPSVGNLSFSDLANAISPKNDFIRQGGQLPDQELQLIADNRKQRRQLAHIKGRVKFQGLETVIPGSMISIAGLGDRFIGNVFVAGVRHSIQNGDWTTQAQFGLDNLPFTEKFNINTIPAGGVLPAVHGLQIGIVSQLEGDPDQEERIMVKIPLINAGEQGIWARVALPDAGDQRTFKFLPEIDDEVLVGFVNSESTRSCRARSFA